MMGITQRLSGHEFVRQIDFRWGQIMEERPHFQRAGQPAHEDDAYTHESVRQTLGELLATVEKTKGFPIITGLGS